MQKAIAAITLVILTYFSPMAVTHAETRVLRIGHFPNLTHAPALAAHARWRLAKESFELKIGKDLTVEWYIYNAGPSAMEALLVDAIDVAYVGPNPAINAFQRSQGKGLKVISGSTLGGAALVVHPNSDISDAESFRGKKIGTPQLGNTQDIAARYWLQQHGINVTQTGGDALVLPAENPDLLSLFGTGKLDAVWTVEPWVTRLENEAGARLYLNEDKALTTVIVASTKALSTKRDHIRNFLSIHDEIVTELNSKNSAVKSELATELKAETLKDIAPEILDSGLKRMSFTREIESSQFTELVAAAQKVGFLKEVKEISGIVDAIK